MPGNKCSSMLRFYAVYILQRMSYLQVYLSEAARLCEIVTSKSSEMNVLLPPKTEGGDYVCFQLCLLSNSVNDILALLWEKYQLFLVRGLDV